MIVVKRSRGNNPNRNDESLMQNDGKDYYTCLLYYGELAIKTNVCVVIVSHPKNIVTEYPLEESIIIGPLSLSVCHRLALYIVNGTRGYASKRKKLEYIVDTMEIRDSMTHWVSPNKSAKLN